MALPPIFLAGAAITYGTRLAATMWDYLIIPGLVRRPGGPPRTNQEQAIRELAFRKALQGIGLPLWGDVSSYLRDNAYRDPVDLIADGVAIAGGAFGGRTILGRFAIAGGVRTVAASLQVFGTLLGGVLRGDRKEIIGNIARLTNESSEARADFARAGQGILESAAQLAAFAANPNPSTLAAAGGAAVLGIATAGFALYEWFSDITGQPNPIQRNPFIVPEGEGFSLETLDPGLRALLPTPPAGPPGVELPPPPVTEKNITEGLETLEGGRIALPRFGLSRGVIISGRDPTTKAIVQGLDIAGQTAKAANSLLRAFGIG